ncbi:benzoylformate decarboxylase [Saccharopolyspora lacisalsi]|uniref:Benzoylformate decarboxylase n=1 Tax=Halosaccharopolyspora lacisalsi TaxID=1000566 RepID=A0A839E125_9PSEU|nr:benzoylformate decarboxylase [Halosaccharopolyspora lacisalsi]
MTTIRDATFDVLRSHELTTMFGNPGSTEVALLTDLPDDLNFVLALHEGSVVSTAVGWALGNDTPALVVLHTVSGFGNAVGALTTARENRAPLVVLVGEQDRRHQAQRPFLSGELDDLAGGYPVSVQHPARPGDVPSAVARAWHSARTHRGPAVVIVPMDDWSAPADETGTVNSPRKLTRATTADPEAVAELVELVDASDSPALVVGAGSDDERTWEALAVLAERLRCPVWQEPFGSRAGFPQDHRLFAGHLPANRSRLREALAPHDAVVAVGAPFLRQYPYERGPLVEAGTRLAIVTDDADEAHRAPVDLALLAPPGSVCELLTTRVRERAEVVETPKRRQERLPVPENGRPLRPGHVLTALADRLPAEATVVEETPSSRPELHRALPARQPLGFLSAATGGLGFAMPAATGLRMARPRRPVVAVVGDGSSLYGIQSLWSAAQYGCGVLFVVLSNGRYAIMDRLSENQGGKAPWPGFDQVSVHGLARSLNCPAARVDSPDELTAALDEVVPSLPDRTEPFLLDVTVAAEAAYEP